ncbi:MAG: thioredoxin domain-containing protein [Ignisphaera sp.]|uniref:Thioredoxin-like fold domain-containing protein n=1 Tax=Ignisphaera aggregans TaxID=334771 RepID=A0A7J3JS63_9CREN
MEKTVTLMIVLLVAISIALISLLFYLRNTIAPHRTMVTPTIDELSKKCNNSENAFVVIYRSIEPNTQLFNILSNSLSISIARNSSSAINISLSLCILSYADLSSALRDRLADYTTFPIFGMYSTSADLSKVGLVTAYFDNIENFFVSKPSVTLATYAYIYNYYNVPILNNSDIYLETIKMPKLNLDTMPVIGSIDAENYLFIYEDAWCPYCAKFYVEILPALEKYIENGAVALVPKNLIVHSEVNDIHRYIVAMYLESRNSTQVSLLINEIYHRVYTNIYPTTEDVLQIMRSIRGSIPDVNKYNVEEIIQEDAREAQYEYGIYATPGFIIWNREKGIGIIILGYRSIETFLNLISSLP